MKNPIIPFYASSGKTIIKSKDCYLYDSDGKKYIDFESGVWCTNVGHNNKKINEIIKKQTEKIIHSGYAFRNTQSEELSLQLQKKLSIKDGGSVFLGSGSEAVNLAITLAGHITKRTKVLKIENSYLSAYGRGQISPGNINLINIPYNNTNSISSVDFSLVSAFVLETGGASLGVVKFPAKDFVAEIIKRVKENNCILIADEVTTGFGRTGKWFGFQHYDLKPDIVVTGKGLGNGYPISAVTITGKIAELFNKDRFRYAQSHLNDPLGCAIGIKVIKIIEQNDLIRKGKKTGKYFRDGLLKLKSTYSGKIADIRARGLMLALELNKSVDGEKLNAKLFEKGFVTGYRDNTLRFMPPLTIRESDIDKLLETIDKILGYH